MGANSEEKETHFFVDSQAAILALAHIECNSATVYRCKRSIEALQRKGKEVTLHWVKAHAGHTLNEKVDEAAKLGTVEEQIYAVPIP